jgi:hypothetical protein
MRKGRCFHRASWTTFRLGKKFRNAVKSMSLGLWRPFLATWSRAWVLVASRLPGFPPAIACVVRREATPSVG